MTLHQQQTWLRMSAAPSGGWWMEERTSKERSGSEKYERMEKEVQRCKYWHMHMQGEANVGLNSFSLDAISGLGKPEFRISRNVQSFNISMIYFSFCFNNWSISCCTDIPNNAKNIRDCASWTQLWRPTPNMEEFSTYESRKAVSELHSWWQHKSGVSNSIRQPAKINNQLQIPGQPGWRFISNETELAFQKSFVKKYEFNFFQVIINNSEQKTNLTD